MKFQNELIWLAKQLDQETISHEPSLWNALRELNEIPTNQVQQELKRHVYITGEPQTVFKLTDLFSSITMLDNVVTLTAQSCNHVALEWMDITYYPPTALEDFPKTKTVTLFTENRLPLWTRKLFIERKISNVVVTETIGALDRMKGIKQFVIDSFSYEQLLDDVIAKEEQHVSSSQQLFSEPPKQYVLQLMALQKNEQAKRMVVLDKMAASMLNTYWLQNNPPIVKWLPILLREIAAFLVIRSNYSTNEKSISSMKAWGKHDKAIN